MNVLQLEDEIANLKAIREDAYTEAAMHNKRRDYKQAADCGKRIIKLSKEIEMRKSHLHDRINFNKVIDDLNNRGILCEAVKRFAEKV